MRNFTYSACAHICKAGLSMTFVFCFFINPSYAAGMPLLRLGEYISVDYLQRLVKTKSPFAAEGGDEINLVVVRQIGASEAREYARNSIAIENQSSEILLTLNFHEGWPEFFQSKSGVFAKIYPQFTTYPHTISIKSLATDVLTISVANSPPVRYIFANFEDTLREVVIAGEYVNELGESYEFTKTGLAHTPLGDFPYVVGSDHVEYKFDYIKNLSNIGAQVVLKLVREGCVIKLFTVLNPLDGDSNGNQVSLWQSLRRKNCSAK